MPRLWGGRAHPQAGQVAERGGGEARSGTVRSLTRAAVMSLANLESTSVVNKLAQGNQLKKFTNLYYLWTAIQLHRLSDRKPTPKPPILMATAAVSSVCPLFKDP